MMGVIASTDVGLPRDVRGSAGEASQPRDACYRVGIRPQHPETPALLVAHYRPGATCSTER
jgi:hypothetical protein